jgi:hypothetical protein
MIMKKKMWRVLLKFHNVLQTKKINTLSFFLGPIIEFEP